MLHEDEADADASLGREGLSSADIAATRCRTGAEPRLLCLRSHCHDIGNQTGAGSFNLLVFVFVGFWISYLIG